MKIKPGAIIEYGLMFLIIFTPLAFGSVHVWAYTLMELIVLFLLLTHLFSRLTPKPLHGAQSTEHGARHSSFPPGSLPPSSGVKSEPLEVTPHSSGFTSHDSRFAFYASLPLLLFFGLILFQMVPLPATIIKHLSPNTYELYQQTLPNPSNVKSKTLDVTIPPSRFSYPIPAPYSPPPDFSSLDPAPRSSLSALSSPHLPPRALTIYGHATKTELLKFFVYGAVFFLVINTIKTYAQIKRLALTIILTGTGVAFLGILQFLSKSDKIYGFWQSQCKIGSYGGPFVNENHFAGYLGMVITLALGFLVSREVPGIIRAAKNWKQRLSLLESWLAKNILLIFIIVLMSSALFLSVSRGGILSYVFSLGLFSLLLGLRKSQKGKRKIILLISGLIFVFLLWLGIGPVVKELATLAEPKKAASERPQVWKDTLSLSRDFPFFGVGLGNFQTIYPKYKTITTPTLWEHAHNDYVEMLADTGWTGLLLFFGGIFIFLFAVMKNWKERRDPFVVGITLGGCTGSLALLCHSAVEFNLHIPANAFLLFIILGLAAVTVHLKNPPPVPVDTFTPTPKITKTLLPVFALVVVFLLVVVLKDFLAYHLVANYQSSLLSSRSSNLVPINQAIFLDSGNAEYHCALGNHYTRHMTETWKQGAWQLIQGHWVFMPGENTQSYGLKALQAYEVAVHLSPANAWCHFYLGWTLNELQRLSEYSEDPMPPDKFLNAKSEFSRAIMLDPNNTYIKNYINAAKSDELRARSQESSSVNRKE